MINLLNETNVRNIGLNRDYLRLPTQYITGAMETKIKVHQILTWKTQIGKNHGTLQGYKTISLCSKYNRVQPL